MEGIMSKNKTQKANSPEQTVDVLYQRMGNRWFAFSLINDEVFVGSLDSEEIAPTADARDELVFKKSGNS